MTRRHASTLLLAGILGPATHAAQKTRAERTGYAETRLEGRWQPAAPSPAGQDVYVIRTTQPLGVLAVELLEPQSDDGLVTWNFFDAHLTDAAAGKPYPVLRVTKPIAFPTRIQR